MSSLSNSNGSDRSSWAPLKAGAIDTYLQPDSMSLFSGDFLLPIKGHPTPKALEPTPKQKCSNISGYERPDDLGKVDKYIQSLIKEEAKGAPAANVDQEELLKFLNNQFLVALDPTHVNVAATQAIPVPTCPALSDEAGPKSKKRRKSSAKALGPDVEQELAKLPEAEREKQRKVLRNRLAARTFRQRQKEQIAKMSVQIDTLSNENTALKSTLKLMSMENKMMKEQLGYFKSFLAPQPVSPQSQQQQQQQQPQQFSQLLPQQQPQLQRLQYSYYQPFPQSSEYLDVDLVPLFDDDMA